MIALCWLDGWLVKPLLFHCAVLVFVAVLPLAVAVAGGPPP